MGKLMIAGKRGFALGLVCLLTAAAPEPSGNALVDEVNRTAPHVLMDRVRLDRLEWDGERWVAVETAGMTALEIERIYFELQRLSAPAWCSGSGLLPRFLQSTGKPGVVVVVHDENGAVAAVGSMGDDICDFLLHSPPAID